RAAGSGIPATSDVRSGAALAASRSTSPMVVSWTSYLQSAGQCELASVMPGAYDGTDRAAGPSYGAEAGQHRDGVDLLVGQLVPPDAGRPPPSPPAPAVDDPVGGDDDVEA